MTTLPTTEMTVKELTLLSFEIQHQIRLMRIKAVLLLMSNKDTVKNNKIGFLNDQLERELQHKYQREIIIDDLLEQLEYYLRID